MLSAELSGPFFYCILADHCSVFNAQCFHRICVIDDGSGDIASVCGLTTGSVLMSRATKPRHSIPDCRHQPGRGGEARRQR